MNSQPNYRGLAFEFSAYKTAEAGTVTMFLGQKARSVQPLKPAVALPANLQFLGRRVRPAEEIDQSVLPQASKLVTA